MRAQLTFVCLTAVAVLFVMSRSASAHPGHGDTAQDPATEASEGQQVVLAGASDAERISGQGDLRFRYRADLSELPEAIARGIKPAHGGFAKGPGGELYFGLEGTGLIRISPDLKEKTLLSDDPALREGGMHNTTYLPRDGGLLVLPDNAKGQVHFYRLADGEVQSVGRPSVVEHYADPENIYSPTDTEADRDGTLYVCDGYSGVNYVVKLDLDSMQYEESYFGGRSEKDHQTPGLFFTNHGVTLSLDGEALWIADRGNRWAQLMTPQGEFVRGIDMRRALVCDIDFVDWRGETLMVAGCLLDKEDQPGVVHLLRDEKIVSTVRPKVDLGLEQFKHIHNAAGIVVDDRLFLLCYGWNPGAFAVLECVEE